MLKKLLTGCIIGIANIVPGVSGGTLAASMGIYDRLIYALTHVFSEFKKSVQFLLPILIGVGIGIVGLSFVMERLFLYYPLQTNFLFIGLILGGLPFMVKKTASLPGKKWSPANVISFLLMFALIILLPLLGEEEKAAVVLQFGFGPMVQLFGVGILASATMVIPGVSGSLILMLMGYYTPILSKINETMASLGAFDIRAVLESGFLLLPFVLGLVIGIFLIAKGVEYLFCHFPLPAYAGILGLIAASPLAICMSTDFGQVTIGIVITGMLCLAGGFLAAMKLGDK